MKKGLLMFCLMVLCISCTTAAAVTPTEENGIDPLIFECPASGDGRHDYTSKEVFVHTRVSDTRCETYTAREYTCTACGNQFISGSNDISEHEYGGSVCKKYGTPT